MILHFRTRSMAIAAIAAAAGIGFVLDDVEAFGPLSLKTSSSNRVLSRASPMTTKKPLTIMYRIRCENKYYQLEELEDADNCTTELFLKEDGTVDIGETDGPLFSKAVGNWEIKENSFAMTITKTFKTGNEKNDMGEFTFDVERVFEGDMTVVGGTEVAINGKIFAEDIITDKFEKEVGFFNMIDGTEQRLERRPDARPKTTGVKPTPITSNDVKGHDGIPKEWLQPQQDEQPQISGYGLPQDQYQQPGISAFGSGSFGQDAQGFGGGGGYGQQQQPASNWGTGSGYEQPQQSQPTGISEYGGSSFGQQSQSFGGTGSGYGQQEQYNDPGPPSFADYGQPQQQEQYNDPGPPSFSDYGQQPQEGGEDYGYYDESNDGYYNQDDSSNYNGGGSGLPPMGGGGGVNPWP